MESERRRRKKEQAKGKLQERKGINFNKGGQRKKNNLFTSAFKSLIRLIKTSLSFINFCSFILLRLKSLVRISILSRKFETSPWERDSLIFSTLKYFFIFFWISYQIKKIYFK